MVHCLKMALYDWNMFRFCLTTCNQGKDINGIYLDDLHLFLILASIGKMNSIKIGVTFY
jgi:hypothetical protein